MGKKKKPSFLDKYFLAIMAFSWGLIIGVNATHAYDLYHMSPPTLTFKPVINQQVWSTYDRLWTIYSVDYHDKSGNPCSVVRTEVRYCEYNHR